MTALQTYIQTHISGSTAQAALPSLKTKCLQVEAADQADIILVTARDGWNIGPAAIAWRTGGAWHTAPVWDGKAIIGWFFSIGAARMVGDKPEVMLDAASGGSGGGHMLYHFKVQPDGTAVTTDTGSSFSRASISFPRFDLAFVGYRSLLSDLISDCNGCIPSSEEALLSWDGQKWNTVAQRIAVDPEVALNLLYAYLGKGDLKSAAQYVSDPRLLDAAKLMGKPKGNAWYQIEPDIYPLRTAEATAWDALPAEFRTTIPPEQSVYSTVVQTSAGQSVPILFKRGAAGWIVDRIDLAGQRPTAAPADRAETVAALDALPKGSQADLATAAHTLLKYLLTLPGWQDSTLPHVSTLPVYGAAGYLRLVHLGDEPLARRLGTSSTWIQWHDTGGGIAGLRTGDTWQPESATLFSKDNIDRLVVIWTDPLQPGAQTISLHGQANNQWKAETVSYDLADVLKQQGFDITTVFPFGVVLTGKDGARFELGAGGNSLKVCRRDGTCVTATWKNGQFEPAK